MNFENVLYSTILLHFIFFWASNKIVNNMYNIYKFLQVERLMYCFQASEPDSRPPPVAFSPKITRKPLKISKIAKKPLNF